MSADAYADRRGAASGAGCQQTHVHAGRCRETVACCDGEESTS
ncbi:MAG TPA: hypothetical protein VHX66_03210 [Solirubrobacteraceae bacterium]|nr:hypothetical protein [Solirubrobacteraceae bacterium]